MRGQRDLSRILDAVQANVHDPPALVASCEQALELLREGDDPRLWASVQLIYGRGLRDLRPGDRKANLERAREALEHACRVYERLGLRDSWAKAQGELGAAYRDRVAGDRSRNIEESIACYRKALSALTTDEARANDEYELARRFRQRVEGDREQNLETAISHFQAALKGYDAVRRPAYRADTLGQLGDCYAALRRGSRRDNLERAISSYEEALAVGGTAPAWSGRVNALRGLAIAYDLRIVGERAHNAERALELFQACLHEISPESHPERWSAVQHGLGLVYAHRERGDASENTERAIEHLTEALRFLTPETTPENWANTQHTLGAAFDRRRIGDRAANLDRAISHFEQALRVRSPGRDPDGWAMTKRSLGLVYSRRGKSREDLKHAIEHLEDALTVRTRERDPLGWARVTTTLAGVYLQVKGDDADEHVARAIPLLRAASEILDPASAPEAWAENRAALVGALERLQGSGQETLRERAEILASLLDVNTVESRPGSCLDIAARLGEALAYLGRWAEAAHAFQTALRALESLYLSSLLPGTRRDHMERGRPVARWAAYALAKAGRLSEAIGVLEEGRARVLGEALDRDHADLERLRERHPRLYAQYREAAERLRRIQEDGSSSDIVGLAEQARAGQRELLGHVEQIRRLPGHEDFLKTSGRETVAAAVADGPPIAYVDTTPWGTLTLLAECGPASGAEIRALWADDFTENDVTAILMRSSDPKATTGFLNGYLMLLHNWVETVFPDGNSAVTRAGGSWEEPGAVERTGMDEVGTVQEVGRRVVAGLAAVLRSSGARRVVLIPCGTLTVMPLHTAFYQEAPEERCLLDDVEVSFAPSARVLVHSRQRARLHRDAPLLAGVGNPLPHAAPLWFADRELEQVASFFRDATRLHGMRATKDRLLDAVASANHVHLACHGTVPFADESPPHLELARGERLTLEEIARERPFAGARLVVLSACQSALVNLRETPDEVVGLPTAIMFAGTPAVIGSLWPVNDLSTALLMERFYALYLYGDPATGEGPMSPARALGRAQKWLATVSVKELRRRLRAGDGLRQAAEENRTRSPGAQAAMHALFSDSDDPEARPFAHPYFWAPFMLIGE
ncbi:CHAT domain-containing protein [Nonomuraea polychroma]|uniref:CHAT domain-containing protein n=1 Tax=Nonomuraea polychroma TaxID=46176 RepID=UPI003D8CB606